ncbi:GTPase IMAP family member 2-like [Poeciliopsis prolifica]|uniref:GTPase IMAP family member 2-like n=1 Tax=Poeciliopsis prolifica TaxID=188132 RepID=UPI002412EF6B|nr:GTPase IMAP family member 2-like [Poeciliopsis prolifica]
MGSNKYAHSCSTPLTVGNSRVEVHPAPLKEAGSTTKALCRVSEPELRVVLLGGNWSQRNLVRTLILGGKSFTTKPNSFIKITGSVRNRKISVINTPDLQFPTADSITEFIRGCAAASHPGPHVFLLVLQPEDFTEEEKQSIHQALYHFNDESFSHSLVMILNPKQEGSILKEERMKNPQIRNLITECRYRYLFQMMVEPQELLIQFDQIMKENNGEHVRYKEPEGTATPAGEDEG